MFAGPKPDPARKLGSPICPKTRPLFKKNPEVNPNKPVDRKVLILKLLLMTRPLKGRILTSPQTLSLPRPMLNRQRQTGLVR